MTSFNTRLNGRTPKTRNKKDGATGRRRRRSAANEFEAAGFTFIEPPAKWSYGGQGIPHVFSIKPGIVNGLAGMVARCDEANVLEWFPYRTKAADIKARLDNLILEIMGVSNDA